jgi:pimeloyl-ACP methyl ester carboxylesterase
MTTNHSPNFPVENAEKSPAHESDSGAVRADQRLARRYYFDDADMDLFFMAALGWGPTGGLDIGQAFEVASRIVDGDPDSWVLAFSQYGSTLNAQADVWKARGWQRQAGEMRLKAFASYRSSWQFALAGDAFKANYAAHKKAFAAAMTELELPATYFHAPHRGKQLPGIFLHNARPEAPLVLVIGGADTCFEDLFLTAGRNLFERGYSVALVDLPGQGATQADGLYWEADAEHSIASVIDVLVARFGAKPGRIALLGLSLGGYFVARAAGYETRVATVMASTPFPAPAQLFALAIQGMERAEFAEPPSAAATRSRLNALWKAGATSAGEFLARTASMRADATKVTVPFLSILGTGDSPVFVNQAETWHSEIRSERKALVKLGAETGADGHVQINGRLRLAQECCGWMSEIFRD